MRARLARRAWWVGLLVGIAAAVLVSSCASGDGSSSPERADSAAPAESTSASDASDEPVADVLDTRRQVVSNASMQATTDDVGAAADRAIEVAESVGGRLFSETRDFSSSAEARLTLQVPPEELAVALDELAELGDLRSQEVSTDDVTAEVVDLDSRIATAEASVGRMRGFLEDTGSVEQLATLERELVDREAELQALEASRATIEAQVAMSTITLELSTPATFAGPGFLDGLEGGLDAAQAVGSVSLVVVGALLPFVPLAALAIVGARLVRRRRAAQV